MNPNANYEHSYSAIEAAVDNIFVPESPLNGSNLLTNEQNDFHQYGSASDDQY